MTNNAEVFAVLVAIPPVEYQSNGSQSNTKTTFKGQDADDTD